MVNNGLPRIIPTLLLDRGALVKTVRFGAARYIGDPINAVKIFNEKRVDELALVDIGASRGQEIDFDLVEELINESFMPLAYGGGVRTVDHIKRLVRLGVEKVILGAALIETPDVVREAVAALGSSSVVGAIDVKRGLLGGNEVLYRGGSKPSSLSVVDLARAAEALGVGELILTSISNEGVRSGYDLGLIELVARAVNIPVVANGGARGIRDFPAALRAGAAAVAAGSMFVYRGKLDAVLISYPAYQEIKEMMDGLAS